jgi:hypothetical protein
MSVKVNEVIETLIHSIGIAAIFIVLLQFNKDLAFIAFMLP